MGAAKRRKDRHNYPAKTAKFVKGKRNGNVYVDPAADMGVIVGFIASLASAQRIKGLLLPKDNN